MQYGTVTGWFGAVVGDTPQDPDQDPDQVPLAGTVTFKPSADALKDAAAKKTFLPASITAELIDGYVTRNGVRGVSLIATDSAELNPRDFTYQVSFSGLNYDGVGVTYRPFSIAVPAGQTIDLAVVAPVAEAKGAAIVRGEKGDPGGTFTYDPDEGLYMAEDADPIPAVDARTFRLPATVEEGIAVGLSDAFEPLRDTAQPLRAALTRVAARTVTHDDSTSAPLRVIGLGSSVGAGATLPDPGEAPAMRLAAQLERVISPLGNVPVLATNGAVNGSTVTAGQQTDYEAAKTAAGGAPTLTVLVYGMNDGMPEQYHRGQNYPGVYANGRALVDAIKADGSDVVIFTTPHPRVDIMTDSFWALSAESQYPGAVPVPAATREGSVRSIVTEDGDTVDVSYRHLRVNDALRRLAADTGSVLIDVERYWFRAIASLGPAALFDEGEYAHPNLLGHQESYWRAIDDFVRSYSRSTVAAAPAPAPEVPRTVFKVDNSAYVGSTTLRADAQLSLAVAAGGHYRVAVHAFYTGSVDSDIRLGLALPPGSTGSAGVAGTGTNAATFGGDVGTFRRVSLPDTYGLPVGCNGADAAAVLDAVVHVGEGGTIGAAFCQDTASGNATTVYADSYMTVERIG